jgi:hypothetical protein
VELQAGFSLGTAPRFAPRLAWPDRLRLNGGVERAGTRVHPRTDWRPLSAEELAVLVEEIPQGAGPPHPAPAGTRPPAVASADGEEVLAPLRAGVLVIPARLRQAWWRTAGQSGPETQGGEDYRRFVVELLEFLRFKRLPLPARCEVEVMASRPHQPGTRLDPDGSLSGLRFAATAADQRTAAINLGDGTTHLVLLNLPAESMRAHLARQGEPRASSLPLPELAAGFFDAYPTYPLTRLRLDAGEGLWFPDADVVYDGWTGATPDVDVVLTIRGEPLVEPARCRGGGVLADGH